MRVFVAGGTGVIGRRLVPQLVARGHQVTATTTSAGKLGLLEQLGAEGIVMDGLDAVSVGEAVAAARPDAIVNEMTALSVAHAGKPNLRKAERFFAATNRLRSEGTDHLLAAGRAVGVRTFVAQSNYALLERTDEPVVDENGRLKQDPPKDVKEGVDAMRHLEEAVTGITWADGIALRYGGFYGPGTGIEAAPDAVLAGLIRKRRFPIVGGGGGVWSMVHITDAASATVAAIERGKPGIYNVADDDPAPVREVLLELSRVLGAKPPRRVPAWVARLLAGKGAVGIMTHAVGISSEKAKRELGWTPRYPSWRTGFIDGLS